MTKKQTFETAMKSLEKIVQELESGDLPIENALERFEAGMKLSKFCSDQLDDAEKKITMLVNTTKGQ